jgi:hypothetical protein
MTATLNNRPDTNFRVVFVSEGRTTETVGMSEYLAQVAMNLFADAGFSPTLETWDEGWKPVAREKP